MGWLFDSIDRAVHRGVKRGVERAVDGFVKSGELDRIVREILNQPEFAWFWFVKHMQHRVVGQFEI